MSYTKKVAFNTGAQMVGKAVITAIALTSIGILTRYLGISGYAEYTTVFAFVSFLAVLADFGFFWIMMRHGAAAKNQKKLDHLASNLFTLRLLIAGTIYLAGFGAGFLFSYPLEVKLGIGLIGGAFFFQSINSPFVGIFQLNFRIDKAVAAEAIGRIIVLAGIIICQRMHLGFLTVLSVYIVGSALNVAVNALLCRRYVKIRLSFDLKLWKKIFEEAWPLGILGILGLIYFKIDAIMLSVFKGAASTDLGIYGAAYKIVEVISSLPLMFLGAVFPIIVRYLKNPKDEKLQNALQKSFDFLLILGFGVVIGTVMTAPKIIAAIGGPEFTGASTVSFAGHPITAITALQILIFSVGISFITSLFSDLIVALGKQKYMIIPNLTLVALNVGLNLYVIPRWSYLGASITTVATEAAALCFSVFVFWRFLKLKPRLKIFPKIFTAGVILAAALYLLQPFNIIVLIVAGTAVYFGALMMLRAVSWGMVREIIGR